MPGPWGLDQLRCGLMELYLQQLLGVLYLGLTPEVANLWCPRNCSFRLSTKNFTLLPEQQSTRPQVSEGWLLIVSPKRTMLEKLQVLEVS